MQWYSLEQIILWAKFMGKVHDIPTQDSKFKYANRQAQT